MLDFRNCFPDSLVYFAVSPTVQKQAAFTMTEIVMNNIGLLVRHLNLSLIPGSLGDDL